MDPGPCPGFSLKDVKWSAVAVPLDLLVSTYRLPQLARLDSVLLRHLFSNVTKASRRSRTDGAEAQR